jgi:hypothetical protein
VLLEGAPDPVRRLLLDALLTYSDSCTLPNLTPSCPYFVQSEAGPTCQEQCRDLIAESGAADRRVRDVQIGGLVLRGRGMPLSVASGPMDYDATKGFLTERRKPPNEQGTGSLLLGLKAALDAISVEAHETADRVMPVWAELERRGVPVERVVGAAMLPRIAVRLGMVASVPAMTEGGLWANGVSPDVLDLLQSQAESGWSQLLKAAIDSDGGRAKARRRALKSITIQAVGGAERFTAEFAQLGTEHGKEKSDWVLKDVRMLYAMSSRFSNRVREWLTRLLNEDLGLLLRMQPPPIPVFLALPTEPMPLDELGLWIWDRFTRTRYDDWSTSSLMQEWRSAKTEEVPLPHLAWSERRTDPEAIASVWLSKSSEAHITSHPERGLSADQFVEVAIGHLNEGRIQEAADIFAGLVELRPADGDALNNLGFCLLPLDPSSGLEELERASLYPQANVVLNLANRALALHLVERDAEALQLATEVVGSEHRAVGRAVMWKHHHDTGKLTLESDVDPVEYLGDLLSHMEADSAE